jgi:hypothetical protein
MEYKKYRHAGLFVAAALVALGGCATPIAKTDGKPTPTRCEGECTLEITLPSGRQPPQLPRDQTILQIKGGTNIDLRVPGASSQKIVLIFEQPAFVERNQCSGPIPPNPTNPPTEGQYVIELKTRTCLTTLDKSACPKDGCKYTIVDFRDKKRQPLDPWIILD